VKENGVMDFYKLVPGKRYRLTSRDYPQDYIAFEVLEDYPNIEKYFVYVTDHGGKTDIKKDNKITIPYRSLGLTKAYHELVELNDSEPLDHVFKFECLIQAACAIEDYEWAAEIKKQKEKISS
jgi:hypothetical protein